MPPLWSGGNGQLQGLLRAVGSCLLPPGVCAVGALLLPVLTPLPWPLLLPEGLLAVRLLFPWAGLPALSGSAHAAAFPLIPLFSPLREGEELRRGCAGLQNNFTKLLLEQAFDPNLPQLIFVEF